MRVLPAAKSEVQTVLHVSMSPTAISGERRARAEPRGEWMTESSSSGVGEAAEAEALLCPKIGERGAA